MVVCTDTSFLFSLYGNDANTARASAWLLANGTPVVISLLNEYELGNAFRFAEFRKTIAPGAAMQYWSRFESDKAGSWLNQQVCNLAEVFNDAIRLSKSRTLTGGHRGVDILHVAAALQFQATAFLTFDANQRNLAEAEGLIVPI